MGEGKTTIYNAALGMLKLTCKQLCDNAQQNGPQKITGVALNLLHIERSEKNWVVPITPWASDDDRDWVLFA